MPDYDIGDVVTISFTVSEDPTTVELRIQAPSGAVTTIAEAQLTGGPTDYTYDHSPDEAGWWQYRPVTTGTAQAAEPGSFYVRPTNVEGAATTHYATPAELRAWLGPTVEVTDIEASRALLRAEGDIDRVAGAWPLNATTGRKFDPAEGSLEGWRYHHLRDAVCAQAEYRLHMGEEFFIEGQPVSVSGPGVSSSGRLPRLAPQAREQLEAGHLLRLTTRARGSAVRTWPSLKS